MTKQGDILRRYDVPSTGVGEGWAIIYIDVESLFFATVSDFGNYAFKWRDIGENNEFRKFLIGLEPDYLHGKLMHGRGDAKVFDGEATYAAVKKHLMEETKKHDHTLYKREKSRLQEVDSFDHQSDFDHWMGETDLDVPWEFIVRVPEPQCMMFCTKTFPRFKEMLLDELHVESGYTMKHQKKPEPVTE